MAIVFPDNPKRENRIVQLGSDTQGYLREALAGCEVLPARLGDMNGRIAALYGRAGMKAPGISAVNIFQAAGVKDAPWADAAIGLSGGLADIEGLVAQTKFLLPAAARASVASGAAAPGVAARVLVDFATALIAPNMAFTGGDVAGYVLAGIFGDAAIERLELDVVGIGGLALKQGLDDAIGQLYVVRTGVRLSQLRSEAMLDGVADIGRALADMEGEGAEIDDRRVKLRLDHAAAPAVARANGYTTASVLAELAALDRERGAYMSADPVF